MQKQTKAKYLAPIIRQAFWSGRLLPRKWRAAIMDAGLSHKSIIKTSFTHMPSSVLLDVMGKSTFVKRWPRIRTLFSSDDTMDSKCLLLFDSTWGLLTTGDSQYPVSEKVASLSKGRMALLSEIVNYPGEFSIYGLAKKLSRPYSRVFKDVKKLVSMDLVEIRDDKRNGRKVAKLYSIESINTKIVDIMAKGQAMKTTF